MPVDVDNSFEAFLRANVNCGTVGGIDYLSTMCKALDVPADFVAQLSALSWPEFVLVGGLAYPKAYFDEARHAELTADGHSAASTQFWCTLLEITGVFEMLSIEEAEAMAGRLAAAWNAKLALDGLGEAGRARAVTDDGEVFVVLGKPDPR